MLYFTLNYYFYKMANKQALLQTHQQIKPYIHQTAILSSTLLNEMAEAELFFKCENFQRMGAFKMRGAINAIINLTEAQKQRGVVTHSSGNFAQAVSLSARSVGIKAYIVMPKNAPLVKQQAVQSYGGAITLCEPTLQARELTAQDIVQKTGATFLHPSNDMDVIMGNATATMELLEEHPKLEIVVAPVGGGGLIAGTALAAHFFGNNCTTIGGEPANVDDAYRSLQSGTIETNETANTIADGLKTNLGDINFPIIQQHVKAIITVSEEEIKQAMRLIWERLKIICEPSCAVPFAALLKEKASFKNKQLGIIITGGNVDLGNLPF